MENYTKFNVQLPSTVFGLFWNEKDINFYKIIDITELCPGSKKCIIKYTNTSDNKSVQIKNCYEVDQEQGIYTWIDIDQITTEQLVTSEAFIRIANGITKDLTALAKFIIDNQ